MCFYDWYDFGWEKVCIENKINRFFVEKDKGTIMNYHKKVQWFSWKMKKTDGKNEKVEWTIVKNHRNRYFGWFNMGSGAFFYVDFISGAGFVNKMIKSRVFDVFWKKKQVIFLLFFLEVGMLLFWVF